MSRHGTRSTRQPDGSYLTRPLTLDERIELERTTLRELEQQIHDSRRADHHPADRWQAGNAEARLMLRVDTLRRCVSRLEDERTSSRTLGGT